MPMNVGSFLPSLLNPTGGGNNPNGGLPPRQRVQPPQSQQPEQPQRETRGSGFLSNLLMSGPALAAIMTADTDDQLQAALADAARMQERQRESQLLVKQRKEDEVNRAREIDEGRDFQEQVTAQQQDFQAEQSRTEFERSAEHETENREIERAAKAEEDERSRVEKDAQDAEERANTFVKNAANAVNLGIVTQARLAELAEAYGRTNDYTPEMSQIVAAGTAAADAVAVGNRKAKSEDREPTLLEQQADAAHTFHKAAREDYKALDASDRMGMTLPQYVDITYGEGRWARMIAHQEGQAEQRLAPPTEGVTARQLVANPDLPGHKDVMDQFEKMTLQEFRGRVEGLSEQDPQFAEALRGALQNPELKRELDRIIADSQRSSRFQQDLDMTGAAIGAVGGVVKNNIANSPLGVGAGVINDFLSNYFVKQPGNQ